MRTSELSALAVLPAATLPAAWAQDAKLGRQKAQACAVCHGAAGISSQPDAPSFAGQPVLCVAAQLKAYRSGERPHEVMGMMAKPLSDDDIGQLAAWVASIRIDAHAPK